MSNQRAHRNHHSSMSRPRQDKGHRVRRQRQDYSELVSSFPQVKLSYEILSHKKVSDADIYFAIPQGSKCYAWFTMHQNTPVCLLLSLDENRQICRTQSFPCSFDKTLSFGTILYGTLVWHEKHRFFAAEDIFMYRGESLANSNFLHKMQTMQAMFAQCIRQVSYAPNFLIIGLPLFHTDQHKLMDMIDPSQKVSHFQCRFFSKNNIYRVKPYVMWKQTCPVMQPAASCAPGRLSMRDRRQIQAQTQQPQTQAQRQEKSRKRVYKVCPDIRNDIYHLYGKENELVDVAYIPDYVTSVMMNKLFRCIKENDNLDALEESDDEEEFEDTREDKFVSLDRSFMMECTFHPRFRKWVPVRVVS